MRPMQCDKRRDSLLNIQEDDWRRTDIAVQTNNGRKKNIPYDILIFLPNHCFGWICRRKKSNRLWRRLASSNQFIASESKLDKGQNKQKQSLKNIKKSLSNFFFTHNQQRDLSSTRLSSLYLNKLNFYDYESFLFAECIVY